MYVTSVLWKQSLELFSGSTCFITGPVLADWFRFRPVQILKVMTQAAN